MPEISPPQFPAGEFVLEVEYPQETKDALILELEDAANLVSKSIDGLTEEQLETKYINWTIRQIVHHLADSHVNAYIRFKWALTEAAPLIKSYNETKWSDLVDAKTVPTEVSISILRGLHSRWGALIRGLSADEMQKTYFHPELMKDVSLTEALPNYVWHTQHHTAQIRWIRDQHNW